MRKLLVHGEEDFVITIDDDAKVTFGPWSPPGMRSGTGYATEGQRAGTLRIYKGSKSTENVIAVFGGVRGFRDLSLEYEPVSPPMTSAVRPPEIAWSEMSALEQEQLVDMVTKKMVERVADPGGF